MASWVGDVQVDMRLDDNDLDRAAWVARRRRANAVKRNIAAGHGFDGTDDEALIIDEHGAAAELGVHLYTGLTWNALSGQFKQLDADVGDDIQVRSTHWPNGGLLCHPGDRPDQRYVCVRTHRLPLLQMVGWAFGYEVMRPEYVRESTGRPACWIMPAEALRPMPDLLVRVA